MYSNSERSSLIEKKKKKKVIYITRAVHLCGILPTSYLPMYICTQAGLCGLHNESSDDFSFLISIINIETLQRVYYATENV